MKAEVVSTEGIVKTIEIEIPKDKVDEKLKIEFDNVSKEEIIPGFRPGKAPKGYILARYKAPVQNKVMNDLIVENLPIAYSQLNLRPIAEPVILDQDNLKINPSGTFEFKVKVETFPETKIAEYKGITLEEEAPEVKEDDIDRELHQYLIEKAEFSSVDDKPIEKGDYIILTIEGSCGEMELFDGLPINQECLVGEDTIFPDTGFETLLIGLKPDDEKTIDLSFPEEYLDSTLAGKTAKITLSILEVKKPEKQEITDEYIKSLGTYESINDFKNQKREKLQKEKEEKIARKTFDYIKNYLLTNSDIQIPDKLVEEQIKDSDTWDELSEEEQKSRKEQMVSSFRHFILYDEIAKKENITVSEDEIDERIKVIASELDQDPILLKATLEKDDSLDDLRIGLKEHKVLEFIREHAVIHRPGESEPVRVPEEPTEPEPTAEPEPEGMTESSQETETETEPGTEDETTPSDSDEPDDQNKDTTS